MCVSASNKKVSILSEKKFIREAAKKKSFLSDRANKGHYHIHKHKPIDKIYTDT